MCVLPCIAPMGDALRGLFNDENGRLLVPGTSADLAGVMDGFYNAGHKSINEANAIATNAAKLFSKSAILQNLVETLGEAASEEDSRSSDDSLLKQRRYYVEEYQANRSNARVAGGKARADVEAILNGLGYEALVVRQSVGFSDVNTSKFAKVMRRLRSVDDWSRGLDLLASGDTLVVQLPIRNHSVTVARCQI